MVFWAFSQASAVHWTLTASPASAAAVWVWECAECKRGFSRGWRRAGLCSMGKELSVSDSAQPVSLDWILILHNHFNNDLIFWERCRSSGERLPLLSSVFHDRGTGVALAEEGKAVFWSPALCALLSSLHPIPHHSLWCGWYQLVATLQHLLLIMKQITVSYLSSWQVVGVLPGALLWAVSVCCIVACAMWCGALCSCPCWPSQLAPLCLSVWKSSDTLKEGQRSMAPPWEQLVQSMGPQAQAVSHGATLYVVLWSSCGIFQCVQHFSCGWCGLLCVGERLGLWEYRVLRRPYCRAFWVLAVPQLGWRVCCGGVPQPGGTWGNVLPRARGCGHPHAAEIAHSDLLREVLGAWEVFTLIFLLSLNRKEFFEGCKAINADSIDGICARFPSLLHEAKQEDKFKDLYRFTFQFGLDSEEGQRSLHREIAIALWKLVFTQNKPPILDQWLHFLVENPSGIKGISRDTWNMFLNFTQVIGPDLSNYSEDEAWPSLFDTFVEWEMERRKKEEETKCITSSDTEGLCAEEQT